MDNSGVDSGRSAKLLQRAVEAMVAKLLQGWGGLGVWVAVVGVRDGDGRTGVILPGSFSGMRMSWELGGKMGQGKLLEGVCRIHLDT